MIPRLIENIVYKSLLEHQKVILLLGARQVGKTTILKNLQEKFISQEKKTLFLNCDLEEERNSLNTTSFSLLANLTKEINLLLIDEVQRLDNPGLTVKIIHDNFKKVKIIASGSSSFELKNKLSESLTGRYLDYFLTSLSLLEILNNEDHFDDNRILKKNTSLLLLPQLLLFGGYPEVYLAKKESDKILFLKKIVESYLFKDILSLQKIRNSKAIIDLTKAISYQIGSVVSENELANRIGINRKTVVSYLDILEKSFVIKRLYPYSQNQRREIGRSYKIYFYDLGIRNALIDDFNKLDLRNDMGFLWENFLFIERYKKFINQNINKNCYFWRSYSGAEVDLIEKDEKFGAFEFKYQQKGISRGAKIFAEKYNTKVNLVNWDNYLDFLT